MSFPQVSVAILTYNRARFLRQTLEALCLQEYPCDEWELLVVDNNSADQTRAVVNDYINRPVPPRYILENHQGLDHARNRAISEARGEVIVLADDDILMEPDWLKELVSPLLSETGKKIGVIGGEVIPIFPDGIPAWLEGAHRPLNFRPDVGPLKDNLFPMGANFAFPRRVFDRCGVFQTTLDRQGTKLFGGGDGEMIRRIRTAGLEVWFSPRAKVLHQIPASRLTLHYALRHAFDSARSRVVDKVTHIRKEGRTPWVYLFARFVGALAKLLVFALNVIACLVICRTGLAKKALVRGWRCCGYIYQIVRSAFGKL